MTTNLKTGEGLVLKKYVIKQLRDLSRVKGKQKTWVSELSDEQLYRLFLMLRNGETAKSIARYIQKAWKVNREASPHSISQGITKFKKRIAHLLITPAPQADGSSPNSFPYDNPDEVEGLEGIERVTQLQLERILGMMKEEKETGVKHTNLSREIHALGGLLKTLLKAKEWDLAYSGVDPIKRQRLVHAQKQMAARFDSLMENITDDGRTRLVGAMERFMELAEQNAKTLVEGPDGRLKLASDD